MRSVQRPAAFLLLLPLCVSTAFVNAQYFRKDSLASLRTFIAAQLTEQKVPGLAIAVIRNDSMLWSEGFGYADREAKIPVTEHTAFPVGSVTKTMTMAGLTLLLNKQGKKLNAPVNRLLKTTKLNTGAFPSDSITIRRVASHTAGLPRYTYACFQDENLTCLTLRKIIEHYAIPVRPAGESYEYSDVGYGVLAQVIRDLSGKEYHSYMQHALFSIAGMRDSFIDTGFTKPQHAAVSYTASGKRLPQYYAATAGEGAAYASAADLARFGIYLLKNKNVFYEMQTAQVQRAPGYSYGLAFHIYENYGGYKVLLHHGHNGFATAAFFLIPAENLCVAVTTNTSTALPVDVAAKVFEQLLPRFSRKALVAESAAWETPTTPYKPDSIYAGEWEGSINIDTARIPIMLSFQEDGDIHVRIARQYRTLLNGVRFEDGYLRASFRSDLSCEDLKYSYNLHLKIKSRGNIMDGSVTASSYGTERTNILSFPVFLKRRLP